MEVFPRISRQRLKACHRTNIRYLIGGVQGGTGSRITRKENSLSQFHDENKYHSRFTKKNSCKQYYDMYKMLTNIPDSTTTLAQRRQRRHGRRRHNYVGTTSPWSPSAQLRWHNVAMVAVGTTTLAPTSFSQRCPNVRKLRWANVFLPTICQRCRPSWKNKKSKHLFFDFSEGALVFQVSNTKLVIKMVLNLNVPFT